MTGGGVGAGCAAPGGGSGGSMATTPPGAGGLPGRRPVRRPSLVPGDGGASAALVVGARGSVASSGTTVPSGGGRVGGADFSAGGLWVTPTLFDVTAFCFLILSAAAVAPPAR